jgi:hypothetical protein
MEQGTRLTTATTLEVDMWADFLLYNYWIAFDGLAMGRVLTDKGKRWIKQIRKSAL